MYFELVTWKSEVEQHLAEINNKLSNLQASREHTTSSSPSERWEDWLESTNLDNIRGDELAPWFGTTVLEYVSESPTSGNYHIWA